MLAEAVTIDLGDSVANGIAAIAAVISVIALFTADSRAKDANKIALDANETSREARDIAREANEISQRSLQVSEEADRRDMYLAVEQPLDDACNKLIDLGINGADYEYGQSIDVLTETQRLLARILARTGNESGYSQFVSRCREVVWNSVSAYDFLISEAPRLARDSSQSSFNTLMRCHHNLDRTFLMMGNYLSMLTTVPLDHEHWSHCTNSLDKYHERTRLALVGVAKRVGGIDDADAQLMFW